MQEVGNKSADRSLLQSQLNYCRRSSKRLVSFTVILLVQVCSNEHHPLCKLEVPKDPSKNCYALILPPQHGFWRVHISEFLFAIHYINTWHYTMNMPSLCILFFFLFIMWCVCVLLWFKRLLPENVCIFAYFYSLSLSSCLFKCKKKMVVKYTMVVIWNSIIHSLS